MLFPIRRLYHKILAIQLWLKYFLRHRNNLAVKNHFLNRFLNQIVYFFKLEVLGHRTACYWAKLGKSKEPSLENTLGGIGLPNWTFPVWFDKESSGAKISNLSDNLLRSCTFQKTFTEKQTPLKIFLVAF